MQSTGVAGDRRGNEGRVQSAGGGEGEEGRVHSAGVGGVECRSRWWGGRGGRRETHFLSGFAEDWTLSRVVVWCRREK